MAQAASGGHQEAPTVHELDDRGRSDEPAVNGLHRPWRAARPEHHRHHRQPDAERDEGSGEQLALLGGALDLGRTLAVATGAIGGDLGPNLVPGGLDGRHDARAVDEGRIEADGCALGGEIHARFSHPIGLAEEALDAVAWLL